MEDSYKFFQNKKCFAFPCHKIAKEEEDNFSCLMCYCPLSPYDDCGGQYVILENGWKDCSECVMPHFDYDYIVSKLIELHNKEIDNKKYQQEK